MHHSTATGDTKKKIIHLLLNRKEKKELKIKVYKKK
jgi:hypothetical protein